MKDSWIMQFSLFALCSFVVGLYFALLTTGLIPGPFASASTETSFIDSTE